MKYLAFVFAFLFTVNSFAQPAYLPGRPVWQQHVDTKIDVRLDDRTNFLDAFEELTYTNNSPDTLHFIYMHLWPNAYKNDRTPFARQMDLNGNTSFYYAKPKDRGVDSMVRVVFLLSQGIDERNHLINLTLSGQKWKLMNNENVTDKQMVDLADKLNGWTQSVYKFGCAFVHLSSFHDYNNNDPFKTLSISETNSVKTHLNTYHGFSMNNELTMENVACYLPMVFDKITDNSEGYIQTLARKGVPDINYL